jgi:hypothetical protein
MKAVITRHTLLVALGIAAVAAAMLGGFASTYGLDAHTAPPPAQKSPMSIPF